MYTKTGMTVSFDKILWAWMYLNNQRTWKNSLFASSFEIAKNDTDIKNAYNFSAFNLCKIYF